MFRTTRNRNWLAGALAVTLLVPVLPGVAQDTIDSEFEFASGLVERGYPDYADKVVKHIVAKHPAQKDRAKLIQAQILISSKKFDQARELIATLPANDPTAQAINLALANAYYRLNRIEEAKGVYKAFFDQYKGRVPKRADLLRYYMDAAYQYGQMLEREEDYEGAIEAYGRVLATNPERGVARNIKSDQAMMYVLLAEKSGGNDGYLKKASDLCNDLQWGGMDIWFGHSIITMARIELARGDKDKARKVLSDNMDILKEVDGYLKSQGMPLKVSPMAGARFMLGELNQEKGTALAGRKDKQEEAIQHLAKALTEYFNVFAKYGDSDWGPEAGVRAQEVKEKLESMGKKVEVDLGKYADEAAATRFKLAETLYSEGKYVEALDEYVKVLNQYPEVSLAPGALSRMAMSYAGLDDPRSVKMVSLYLGERFSNNPEGALGLLQLGKTYFDKQDTDMYYWIYETYLDYFPEDTRAASILYTLAGMKKKAGDEEGAKVCYQRIVENYPKDQYFLKALSSMAWDAYLAQEYEKAIPKFETYVERAQPGFQKAQAQFCKADAEKQTGNYRQALISYATLLKWLDDEDTPYNSVPDDVPKNADLKEKSMFFMGYCYSRIKDDDPAKQEAYRKKAIQFYKVFLSKHPNAKLAPNAMDGMGRTQIELGQYDGAVATYNDLAVKYPDSDEGKNALFSLIRSAMEVEKFEVAQDAMTKMMNSADSYSADEFSRVGQLMLDNGLNEEALQAFDQVRKLSKERQYLERALYGLGAANFAMGNNEDAIRYTEELMERYPKSGLFYDAKFILGNAYKATEQYDEATQALSDVFRYADNAVLINEANYLLGQIQQEQENLEGAMASFQRVALLVDPNDKQLRPLVEKCILESINVGMQLERYADVQDSCDQYLKDFPDSEKVEEIRKIKADAKLKETTKKIEETTSAPDETTEP